MNNPDECKHLSKMPAFDEAAAKVLMNTCKHPPDGDPLGAPFGICNACTSEVRKRWPRYSGPCPDCGANVILYGSFAHYTYGDW